MILLKQEDSSLHYLSDKIRDVLISYCNHKTFVKSLICKQNCIIEEFKPLFQLYLFVVFFEDSSYFPDLGNYFTYFYFVSFYEVIILNGKQNQAVVELKDMDRGEISPGTRKRQASFAALGFAGVLCCFQVSDFCIWY